MPTNALLGAIAGAVVGAIVWAAISYFTGYEVGYVAWGIGAAVGGLAGMGGSRGVNAGVTCAVLAAVAILGGKVIAVHFSFQQELEKLVSAGVERGEYDALAEGAAAFAEVGGPAEHAAFLVDRGWTEAETPEEVSGEDLVWFAEETLPLLQKFHPAPPDFAVWRREQIEERMEVLSARVSTTDMLKKSFGLFDLLWIVLGVGTAFQLGQGQESSGKSKEFERRVREGSDAPRAGSDSTGGQHGGLQPPTQGRGDGGPPPPPAPTRRRRH